MTERYNTLSTYLRRRFGCKVYKVTVDGGFTCPTRDGTKSRGGCAYCNPAGLVPKAHKGRRTVTEQIDSGVEWVRKRHGAERFIAYFQLNTNTYSDTGRLRDLYEEAVRHPEVAGLCISTRPDCVPDDVLDLLEDIGSRKALWLEMGLQSANDSTLERINRGHTSADFRDAVERARGRGIDVCAHVIFGLPGEREEDMLGTVRFVSELGVWGIKFHQLTVLCGTPLEDAYLNGGLKPLGLEEYVRLVVESLELLPPWVVVHRLSGDAPARYVVAPRWGVNKFIIKERIEGLLEARDTRQGMKWRG